MGLAARPGRGVPAVHHAHETPGDRRIPGWRTGPEPVGSAVPAVHVSAARGAPGSGSCAGILKDCNIPAVAHGFRSTFRDWAAEETDHPREVIEAALPHVVGNKVEAACARPDLFARRRRLMNNWGSLPCRRAPEGAGAHRTDRTTPCRAGVGHAPHRVDRARGTPDPAGLGRIGSGRQPAGAWVSSTSHATTALGRPPRRWSAILVDGDRDALHRDRVVVPPAPVLSLLTPCQVERLACTHSRPIRPRSG